jgi:pimeloyl-ACP methyl ester carboxylesterase
VLVGWSLGGRVLRQYLMHYGDGALSGINFLASRPIEDPASSGPASKAMQGDTSRDLAGRIAASVAFLRACYEKQPTEPTSSRRSPTTHAAVRDPRRDRRLGDRSGLGAQAFAAITCRRWSPTAGATG